MLPPADQLTMRATVIADEKGKNDSIVMWNGIKIGRILKVSAVGGRSAWTWGVAFPHRPQLPAHRGQGSEIDECKRRFKVVWSSIHRELTEADVDAARSERDGFKERPCNRYSRAEQAERVLQSPS